MLTVSKLAEEYFTDIAIAYQEEIKELYELGCRTLHPLSKRANNLTLVIGNIQFDDPLLAYFCAESMKSRALMVKYIPRRSWKTIYMTDSSRKHSSLVLRELLVSYPTCNMYNATRKDLVQLAAKWDEIEDVASKA